MCFPYKRCIKTHENRNPCLAQGYKKKTIYETRMKLQKKNYALMWILVAHSPLRCLLASAIRSAMSQMVFVILFFCVLWMKEKLFLYWKHEEFKRWMGSNVDDLISVNRDVVSIIEWLGANKLSLNVSKHYVIFTSQGMCNFIVTHPIIITMKPLNVTIKRNIWGYLWRKIDWVRSYLYI